MELIEHLNWRYATKKFDPAKKINDSDLEKIKEAIRLSATSYGLQLFKVLIVEDPELRKKLQPASWGQSQIVDASHLLVFCNYSTVREEDIDGYVRLKAEVNGIEEGALKGYGDFVKDKLLALSPEVQSQWTSKQTYIVMSNLLTACAALKIDACPMEGYDQKAYNEILGLSSKNLNAAVVATIGYRSDEDEAQHSKKVRKPASSLFETV